MIQLNITNPNLSNKLRMDLENSYHFTSVESFSESNCLITFKTWVHVQKFYFSSAVAIVWNKARVYSSPPSPSSCHCLLYFALFQLKLTKHWQSAPADEILNGTIWPPKRKGGMFLFQEERKTQTKNNIKTLVYAYPYQILIPALENGRN